MYRSDYDDDYEIRLNCVIFDLHNRFTQSLHAGSTHKFENRHSGSHTHTHFTKQAPDADDQSINPSAFHRNSQHLRRYCCIGNRHVANVPTHKAKRHRRNEGRTVDSTSAIAKAAIESIAMSQADTEMHYRRSTSGELLGDWCFGKKA